jgi:glycine hydroxymethyltransferase
VAEFVHRAVKITQSLKSKVGPKQKDFREYVNNNDVPEIAALKADVEAFAKQFPTIGFEKSTMRYKN